MRTEIVVISGPQGSGKSTIARELLYRYNNSPQAWTAVEVRFAEVIYNIHDSILKTMADYGVDVPKKDGRLLQLLGTDWGRQQYGEDVWVKTCKRAVANFVVETNQLNEIGFEGAKIENLLFVISDCRFVNEFFAFPEALRVRLECPEEKRKLRADAWRENTNHPSETSLDYLSKTGAFDLYLDTATLGVGDCVDLIRAQIDKQSWLEKRAFKYVDNLKNELIGGSSGENA